MDTELKQYLQEMEARLNEQSKAHEERLAARIDESAKALEDRLIERIRDTETKLLTEFHKWASPVELRARSHAAAIKAMDAEIESLGDRVQKLEDRPTGT